MTPIPITHRLVSDRISRYRAAADRRGLAQGRIRRPRASGSEGLADLTVDERP